MYTQESLQKIFDEKVEAFEEETKSDIDYLIKDGDEEDAEMLQDALPLQLERIKMLDVEKFTAQLKSEIIGNFKQWMNPDKTGAVTLAPVENITIECDSHGWLYAALTSNKAGCIVATGACPNLYDWGIVSSDEGDYDFENRASIVGVFLAQCYLAVLPEACKSPEFLALPRESKVTFTVGAHSGWQADNLYVYEGEHYEIDYGNVRLRILEYKAHCKTKEGTAQHAFMQELAALDVEACAKELFDHFHSVFTWLTEQKVENSDYFLFGYSSNFEKPAACGTVLDKKTYRYPTDFDCGPWFLKNRSDDLDATEMDKVRSCVSHKIAEIACIAMESFAETDLFKNFPKADNFSMKLFNRTDRDNIAFYPFTKEVW